MDTLELTHSFSLTLWLHSIWWVFVLFCFSREFLYVALESAGLELRSPCLCLLSAEITTTSQSLCSFKMRFHSEAQAGLELVANLFCHLSSQCMGKLPHTFAFLNFLSTKTTGVPQHPGWENYSITRH